MPRTLETIFAEWKALESTVATIGDSDNAEWNRAYDRMSALETEMRAHPARTMREIAMKIEPLMLNTDRDPNFTGVIEDIRERLTPAERVTSVCPQFVYCARSEPVAPE